MEDLVVLENQRNYYRELARLRGDLIGDLMGGNRAHAGYVIKQIDILGTDPAEDFSVEKKQRLKDALTALSRAVEEVIAR